MNTARRVTVVVLGLMALLMCLPALGQVPDWAVGTFRGHHRNHNKDVEYTISDNGDVTRRVWEQDGSITTAHGSFRDRQMFFGSDTYNVRQSGRGINVVKTSDRSDNVTLNRTGGFQPPSGGQVPDWAIGTFRGHHRNHNKDVEYTISDNGDVTRRVWEPSGSITTANGSFHDGQMFFGSDTYNVRRTGRGINVVKTSDRSDNVTLNRSGFRPLPGGRPPSGGRVERWLIGTFRGYSNARNANIEVNVNGDGSATLVTWQGRGDRKTINGKCVDGATLNFGFDTYFASRRGSGITITNRRDSNDTVDLNRR